MLSNEVGYAADCSFLRNVPYNTAVVWISASQSVVPLTFCLGIDQLEPLNQDLWGVRFQNLHSLLPPEIDGSLNFAVLFGLKFV